MACEHCDTLRELRELDARRLEEVKDLACLLYTYSERNLKEEYFRTRYPWLFDQERRARCR
jgi:hypothetical protein